MRYPALAAILLLFALPLYGAATEEIDNVDCNGLNDPYPCCSGSGAGSCDDKSSWPVVFFSFTYTNACEVIWDQVSCGDDGNANIPAVDWPVTLGICTAAEAEAGTVIKDAVSTTQTCTQARIDDGVCDSAFLDEEIPKLSQCQKAFDEFFGQIVLEYRGRGRQVHEAANAAPVGNNDPTGQN